METSMISLRNAENSEMDILTEICTRAFASDMHVGASDPQGGPPGFNSVQWHRKMMTIAARFLSIRNDDTIIGGILVFRQPDRGEHVYNLGRIWIDPSVHRQGLGLRIMDTLLSEFPDARLWTLETPPWNIRTRNFYTKAGFTLVGTDSDNLFFEKQTNMSIPSA